MLLSKFENLVNVKSATCCLLDQMSTRGQYSATNDGDARQVATYNTNTFCIVTRQHKISTLNPIKKTQFLCPLLFY